MSRYTLGIDTSNYATSLAVFDTAGEVVCAKKRFLPVKEGQLGLRQSDALFHHTTALPEMLEELSGEFDLTQISAVGVSQKPRPVEGSYMPCFLAGVSAATAFSKARGIPLIRTTHQQGHAAAALFAAKGEELFRQKVLLFHISGGTTDLLLCDQVEQIETLGTSTDLYAGQAVDRVGVKLGFGFPAGLPPCGVVWGTHQTEIERQGDAVQPFRAGKPVQCPACRREKPGLCLQILLALRGGYRCEDDQGRAERISGASGGLRGRRHEQRYHPPMGAAASAAGVFCAGPVFQ